MRRLAALLALCAFPALAFAQSAILQGGAWQSGHAPAYGGGTSQPVVIDSGPARGGDVGSGVSELAVTARGTGTAPFAGQGTGPLGTISCVYDGPVTAPNGYHFLCFSANAQNGGLITYGAGGIATPLPLNFNINGAPIVGVTCNGTPTSSFASVNGIVTHC